jgi:uncharacterized membrane protein
VTSWTTLIDLIPSLIAYLLSFALVGRTKAS